MYVGCRFISINYNQRFDCISYVTTFKGGMLIKIVIKNVISIMKAHMKTLSVHLYLVSAQSHSISDPDLGYLLVSRKETPCLINLLI